MKKNISYLIMLSCLIYIFGCVGMKVERTVKDNIFYSSFMPKITVITSPDFKFIGKVENVKHLDFESGTGGTFTKSNSYIFGKVNDLKVITKGVLIMIMKTHSGYWLPELFSYIKNPIDEGVGKINDQNYQYCVAPHSIWVRLF